MTYEDGMIFAVPAILLTLVVAVAVALPLFRRRDASDGDFVGADPIYRDQLKELERERRDGLIDEVAYEASRAEIGRRLIASEARAGSGASAMHKALPHARLFAGLAIVSVLICSAFAYPLLGAPGVKDQPLAARLNKAQPELSVLVAQVERHLLQNPDDVRGWDVLAPVYLRENRLGAAYEAFGNALRLGGPTPERLIGFGETVVAQSGGLVSEEALEAFQKVETLSPDNMTAAYYVALAAEQAGDHRVAIDRFTALLEQMPDVAPGRETLTRHIAFNRNRVNAVEAPGPDEQDVEAAAALSPQQRADMIEGMVAGLADRLGQEPDDIDGWVRLVRSYVVLGEDRQARSALNQAMAFFGTDSEAGARLETLAAQLGISGDTP